MADRPQYPDSTGSWQAPPSGRRADARFMDRTDSMKRTDRHGESTIDELITSRRSAEAPPPPANTGAAWSGPSAPTEAHMGDPELAAAAGMDGRGPEPYAGHSQQPEPAQPAPPAPPRPPQPAPPAMPTAQPVGEPVENAYAGPPPHVAPAGIDEPTRVHNPVQPQQPQQQPPQYQQQRYPEQVAEGVYRRNRKGLGLVLVIITCVMAGIVGFMLVNQFTADGPLSPSAALAAAFALTGLPLVAWGLYPVLGMGSQSGPDHYSALLRPPYAYLLTGLVLLIAAGLAA